METRDYDGGANKLIGGNTWYSLETKFADKCIATDYNGVENFTDYCVKGEGNLEDNGGYKGFNDAGEHIYDIHFSVWAQPNENFFQWVKVGRVEEPSETGDSSAKGAKSGAT